jgi:protein required for attachment to host cells
MRYFLNSIGENMKKFLVVISNRIESKIIILTLSPWKIFYFKILQNLDKNKKKGDFYSDGPGKTNFSNGVGSRRVYKNKSSLDNSIDLFAQKISKKIKEVILKNEKIKTVIISEPSFLGNLKRHLKKTHIEIYKIIPKEFNGIEQNHLPSIIKNELGGI